MKIELLCFAAMKDYFPSRSSREFPDEISVSELKGILKAEKPDCSSVLNVSRIAINQQIVQDEEEIEEGSVVAVLPPSSGG